MSHSANENVYKVSTALVYSQIPLVCFPAIFIKDEMICCCFSFLSDMSPVITMLYRLNCYENKC